MDDLFGGMFGDMFDFDGDGELDPFEQATEFGFVMGMMDEDEVEPDEDGDEVDEFDLDEFDLGEFEDDEDGEDEEY